jgi:hypothetical protein
MASLVNRRFYRQGLNWAVAGFKLITGSGVVGEINVQKLPNSWVMSNAWEKGMRAWLKMNNEALAENESVRPRFMDFKIHADAVHHNAGFASNLLPASGAGTLLANYQRGEWTASKVNIPFGPSSPGNTNDLEIMAVGANYNGGTQQVVSLIEGYAASRGLPNVVDPNTPDDADDASGSTPENWLSALFNEGTSQVTETLDDLIEDNNQAPYPFENGADPAGGTFTDTMYPGGANQGTGLAVHDFEYVTGTTIGGTTRLKGGNFPCGLIRIQATNFGEETTGLLLIDLVPGHHRGYLCEPMTEM